MLRDIKQKSSGLGAKIVMGLLIIAFAFWGVSGSILTAGNDGAATVNGEKISIVKFNQANQAQRNRLTSQFGDNLGAEYFESENFKRGIMNQLVDAELLKQVAEDLDYDVSPETIKEYLEQSSGLQIDGKFSKEAYANYLAQVNKSAELLQREIKEEIKGSALPILVSQSAFSLAIEIENQYKLSKQTRSFDYIELSSAEYLDTVNVSDEEINDHYKEFSSNYMTTDQVSVNYIELTSEDLLESIEISDEEVSDFYQSKKDNLATPEKRLTNHILLPINDNEEEVKLQINQIAERLKSGEEFVEVAKEVSKDPGSASNGGDLGWVSKGDMAPAFDETLFSMSAGEISEPVLTSFGYHLIQLKEIREPAIPSLEESKESLIEEIKIERANDQFLIVASDLDESIVDADNVLELASDSSGIEVKTTELFSSGQGTGIAANPAFNAAAFSELVKDNNEISEMIDLGDNHIAYLHVKEYVPATVKPLEEVSESIRAKLKSDKAIEIVKQEAQKYVEEVNSGDKTLESIATELDKTLTVAENIARVGSSQPFNLVKNVFNMKLSEDNTVESIESSNNAFAIVDLKSVNAATVSELNDEERNSIAGQIERTASTNEIINITSELRNKASISINDQVFEDPLL